MDECEEPYWRAAWISGVRRHHLGREPLFNRTCKGRMEYQSYRGRHIESRLGHFLHFGSAWEMEKGITLCIGCLCNGLQRSPVLRESACSWICIGAGPEILAGVDWIFSWGQTQAQTGYYFIPSFLGYVESEWMKWKYVWLTVKWLTSSINGRNSSVYNILFCGRLFACLMAHNLDMLCPSNAWAVKK